MPSIPLQPGMVFWFTGLSGAGKSTLAQETAERLLQDGIPVVILDGDVVRRGLCGDLGFSPKDREENNRRVAEVAKILALSAGQICLCSFISPTRAMRERSKAIIGTEAYREIYVQCDIKTCILRDPKGNYKKALNGLLRGYTGIGAPYEEPRQPDLTVDTEDLTVTEATDLVYDFIRRTRSEILQNT